MCDRCKRRSNKQTHRRDVSRQRGKELFLDPEDEIAPGSIQPVVLTNRDGERQIERMRWGFKLSDRLLFNARSEETSAAKFWSERFRTKRCIVPADAFFEWVKAPKGAKPKYEFTVRGREPFGMAAFWSAWKNPKTEA
jgi:putative SOS response-associated peptidase YedK